MMSVNIGMAPAQNLVMECKNVQIVMEVVSKLAPLKLFLAQFNKL